VFDVLGGIGFARIGKADPSHARSAVRRLYTVGVSLVVASDSLKEALESADQRQAIQRGYVLVSQIETAHEHLLNAIQDWEDVHPEALSEVRRGRRMAEEVREGITRND